MGWIIAIIVGGVAGWLASLVMNRDASMGIFWNIVVGIIGSVIGNLIAGPLLGIGGSIQEFSIMGTAFGCRSGQVEQGGSLVRRKSQRLRHKRPLHGLRACHQ